VHFLFPEKVFWHFLGIENLFFSWMAYNWFSLYISTLFMQRWCV
jgi:hypothetical protein